MIAKIKSILGIGRKTMKPGKSSRRGYEGAAFNRLTADMSHLSTATADSEIRHDIVSLRIRARHLERESDYVSRFLTVVPNNVLQDDVGMSLQMKVMRAPEYDVADVVANRKIERAWSEWREKENCTENQEDSFYDVLNLSVRAAMRDGGILIRKVIDPDVNDFGFALSMIEIDLLDVNMNEVARNGNRIVMGVEKDKRGRVVAYHLLKRHPGDLLFGQTAYRDRIPASEIIHYFVKERVTQCVGVPWFVSSMLRLQHLKEYEQAELVASREAAVKGGYFTSDGDSQYAGEEELDAEGKPTGNVIANTESGSKDELPKGMGFTPYDPQHPTSQYGDFVKNALFGICAGMKVSYATLTGDLSNANYSSMRTGKLDEQEGYKKIQCHVIKHLCSDIFKAWLEVAMTKGKINLPMSKFKDFNKPKFTGRRWPWVDPRVDVQAAIAEIEGGLNTRTQVMEEQGRDLEEVFQVLDNEKVLAEKHGLVFTNPNSGGGQTQDKEKSEDDAKPVKAVAEKE